MAVLLNSSLYECKFVLPGIYQRTYQPEGAPSCWMPDIRKTRSSVTKSLTCSMVRKGKRGSNFHLARRYGSYKRKRGGLEGVMLGDSICDLIVAVRQIHTPWKLGGTMIKKMMSDGGGCGWMRATAAMRCDGTQQQDRGVGRKLEWVRS